MFKKIRHAVGLLYARWRLRKYRDAQQVLTNFFSHARSILILLPSGYEEAIVACTTLKKLKNVLQNAHLTIVTTGTRSTPLAESLRSEVIRLDELDVNTLYLPDDAVLQRILARPYDLAIDLNLDFVLHAAYICKASRAPVRVGIKRDHADSFFNVQLNVDPRGVPKAIYEKFVQQLSMF